MISWIEKTRDTLVWCDCNAIVFELDEYAEGHTYHVTFEWHGESFAWTVVREGKKYGWCMDHGTIHRICSAEFYRLIASELKQRLNRLKANA